MPDDDPLTCEATATGILQCLRMLADEAASLQLTRTLDALREAIKTCADEHPDPFDCEFESAAPEAARVLH
jgi:hypothetical protein